MISDYHAPYVSEPQDVRDFLRFCEAFVSELDNHHHMEETTVFALFVEATGNPEIMDSSAAEHKAFTEGLLRMKTYATTTDPAAYKSEDLLAIMDSFMPALVHHLRSEIETILAMRKYDSAKILQALHDGSKAAVANVTMDEQLPFLFSTNDKTFEGGKHSYFPPVPVVLNFAVNWWFSWKHRGAWRFSPCDMYGQPKPPAFGPGAR